MGVHYFVTRRIVLNLDRVKVKIKGLPIEAIKTVNGVIQVKDIVIISHRNVIDY